MNVWSLPGLHCIQVADHIKIASGQISMLNRTPAIGNAENRTALVSSRCLHVVCLLVFLERLQGNACTCCLLDAKLVPCSAIANPVKLMF